MADDHPHILSQQRRAGVCLHLTSLPGTHGIGEIGQVARQFIDVLSGMQISVWQFLPAGPTGYGNSPYQLLSSFAGNEMLIGVDELVRAGLLKPGETRVLSRLPARTVNFDRLIPAKTMLLELAAKRFPGNASADLKAGFDSFVDEHDDGWLHDYALFRVLKSQNGEREWSRWPQNLRQRDRQALRDTVDHAGDALERIKIQQFLFSTQWRALRAHAKSKGVLLFGDMPIYISFDSADAWSQPASLQLDERGQPVWVAGVPPDYFSADGQLWGNPVYDWAWHADNRFGWWKSRFQRAANMVDLVRIDHFRGFESFFAIRHGEKTARHGHWISGPGDALFNALNENHGRLPVVAEDLGIITAEVDALRRRQGFPGMRVLQFEVLRKDFDISCVEENSVCYTGTHDNDTTLGWYRGDPGGQGNVRETRKRIREACDGRAASIHRDMTRLAFSSPAQLAVAPLQDILGLDSAARLNTPGSTGNNWRWRMRHDSLDKSLSASIAKLIDDNDRGAGAARMDPFRATM